MKRESLKEPIITQIPYVAHESAMYRLERYIKRLWLTLIISLICVLVMAVFCVYNAVEYSKSVIDVTVGEQGDPVDNETRNF